MEIVVASGEWLYDGSVPTVVRIVKLDYDFWFGIGEANGDLEEGEQPSLNDDGYLFYVRHRPWGGGEPFWPDSGGFASLEEAKAAAEGSLPSDVVWK